jgi:hypothetical protein
MPTFLQGGLYTSIRTGIGPSENPLVSKMYTVCFQLSTVVVHSVVIVVASILCSVTCSDILEELIASIFRATELVQVHAGVMQ